MEHRAVTADTGAAGLVETDVPARLDRLPWSRFHTLVVAALGITWILDGLEVTLAGSVAGALKASPILRFSNSDVGVAASANLGGAVLGGLLDRDCVADRDLARLDHLGIDAAIHMAESLHQRARHFEIADAGVGIDFGCGAAHDPLDHL